MCFFPVGTGACAYQFNYCSYYVLLLTHRNFFDTFWKTKVKESNTYHVSQFSMLDQPPHTPCEHPAASYLVFLCHYIIRLHLQDMLSLQCSLWFSFQQVIMLKFSSHITSFSVLSLLSFPAYSLYGLCLTTLELLSPHIFLCGYIPTGLLMTLAFLQFLCADVCLLLSCYLRNATLEVSTQHHMLALFSGPLSYDTFVS